MPPTSDGIGPRVDRGVLGRVPPRERLGAIRLDPAVGRGRCAAVERRLGAGPLGACQRRKIPCSCSHAPGDISSQRSMMAAARGSVARASDFSLSVRVTTRRARISSISVAS